MHESHNGRCFTPPKRTLSQLSKDKQLTNINEVVKINVTEKTKGESTSKTSETPEAIITGSSKDVIICSYDGPPKYHEENKQYR